MAQTVEQLTTQLEKMNARLEKAQQRRGPLSAIRPFFFGALVGAGAALLYAPQTGERTREMLRRNAGELQESALSAKETLQSTTAAAQDTAQKTLTQVGDKMNATVQDGRAKANDGVEETKQAAKDGGKQAQQAVDTGSDKGKAAADAAADATKKARSQTPPSRPA